MNGSFIGVGFVPSLAAFGGEACKQDDECRWSQFRFLAT